MLLVLPDCINKKETSTAHNKVYRGSVSNATEMLFNIFRNAMCTVRVLLAERAWVYIISNNEGQCVSSNLRETREPWRIYASKWIVLPPVFTQTSCSHLSHLEIFCRNTECNLKCCVHVLTLFVVTSLRCLKNGER
uniref:Uncharacterized protein n=1 Tax=Glossina austeni TaxID=7395 RepID=A0A1A9UDZ4_GLOAU